MCLVVVVYLVFSAVMFVGFSVFAGLWVDLLVGILWVGYCWFVFVCCLSVCGCLGWCIGFTSTGVHCCLLRLVMFALNVAFG